MSSPPRIVSIARSVSYLQCSSSRKKNVVVHHEDVRAMPRMIAGDLRLVACFGSQDEPIEHQVTRFSPMDVLARGFNDEYRALMWVSNIIRGQGAFRRPHGLCPDDSKVGRAGFVPGLHSPDKRRFPRLRRSVTPSCSDCSMVRRNRIARRVRVPPGREEGEPANYASAHRPRP